MTPESITPGVLYLVSDEGPSRVILGAGCGVFAQTHIYETDGVFFPEAERTPEMIAKRFAEISEPAGQRELQAAYDQTFGFVNKAAEALGIPTKA
jgi:hypothetical protein